MKNAALVVLGISIALQAVCAIGAFIHGNYSATMGWITATSMTFSLILNKVGDEKK